MKDLIIEQIERRARLDHSDFTKAAAEYFRDHPDFYPAYKDEIQVPVGPRVQVSKSD